MVRVLQISPRPVWRLRIRLKGKKYGKKCGCTKDGGSCECGPDCQCPHCQAKNAFKRLGTSPRNNRDHPIGCIPHFLITKAFKTPKFIPPSTYRIVQPDEQIGPKAGRKEVYKNPEYYSYYRFSYYDLKTIVSTIKDKMSANQSK